jgi:hypothetical protein
VVAALAVEDDSEIRHELVVVLGGFASRSDVARRTLNTIAAHDADELLRAAASRSGDDRTHASSRGARTVRSPRPSPSETGPGGVRERRPATAPGRAPYRRQSPRCRMPTDGGRSAIRSDSTGGRGEEARRRDTRPNARTASTFVGIRSFSPGSPPTASRARPSHGSGDGRSRPLDVSKMYPSVA